MNKEETAVTQWLKANDAGEFIDNFYNKSYFYVEDLSEEVIRAVIPSAEKNQGIIAKLVRILKQQNSPAPTPSVPKLPAGTSLDLSCSSFSVNNVSFSIPNALSVAANSTEVVSASVFEQDQWLVLAKKSSMLYGINLNKAFRLGNNEPIRCSKPVLHWQVPAGNNFFRCAELSGSVKSFLSYTEETSKSVSNGYVSGELSGSFPYASFAFEYQKKEKIAKSSYSKKLYMNGLWEYPRVDVYLEYCSVVSDKFIEEVRDCFKLEDDTDIAVALDKVFETYGHAVARHVTLGGKLCFVYEEQKTGDVSEHTVTNTVACAVSLKTEKGGADAKFSEGSGQLDMKEVQRIVQTTSFEATGGDTTLASSPGNWAGTVKNPNLWEVISCNSVVSTAELLPPELKAKVYNQWDKRKLPDPFHNKVFALSPYVTNSEDSMVDGYPVSRKVYGYEGIPFLYGFDPSALNSENNPCAWRFIKCNVVEDNVYWIQQIQRGGLLDVIHYKDGYWTDSRNHGEYEDWCMGVNLSAQPVGTGGPMFRIKPFSIGDEKFNGYFIIESYSDSDKIMTERRFSISWFNIRNVRQSLRFASMSSKGSKISDFYSDPANHESAAWRIGLLHESGRYLTEKEYPTQWAWLTPPMCAE